MLKRWNFLKMLFAISLILLINCTRDKNNITGYSVNRETGTTPEYFVYSTILNSFKGNMADAVFVLSDSTISLNLSNEFNYIKINFPELQDETFESYTTVNQQRIELLNIPDLDITCYLINARYAIYWKELYPNAAALIHFSGVGFNPNEDQALISVSKYIGPLGATASLILLSKENNEWTIIKSVLLWTS